MVTVGFILTYIGSNLWYLYGHATKPESFDILRLIKDLIILPTFLFENFYFSGDIKQVFNKFIYLIFRPVSFNLYSSFRRSLLE